ncbi:MAG TPA: hypothetical protein PKA17_02240, partial [Phenylobacterium sp.]|nr:hypothetical protein [Phenylobacterium sp.]
SEERMASHIAPVAIRRDFDASRLAAPPDDATLNAADEDGAFDGNRAFINLRGMDWADVAETLKMDRGLLARLEAAVDLDDEQEAITEELVAEYGVGALWSLDPGVASATIALSALGATPVASCNGGVLGGQHKEAYPLVAFYLPITAAAGVNALAEAAGIGLLIDDHGRGQIYAQSCQGLVKFAELALAGRQLTS